MIVKSQRMRTYIALLSVVFILASIIIWHFADRNPIKIGFAATLSGINSELGVSGRNGATLALNRINENGGINGRPLELISKDDQNDVDIALDIDNAFFNEGIHLIIGHMTSQMAVTTVPFINEKHMLMLSPTIAADDLTGKEDYFYRVIPSNKTQAWTISEKMKSDGLEKVGVVIDCSNPLFTTTLRAFFTEYFQATGGEVVYLHDIICNNTNSDGDICDECLNTIRSPDFDGIFILTASDRFALYAQRLYQHGVQTKLYGPAWAMTTDLLARGGKSVDGAVFVNYYDNQSTSPDYLSFHHDYVERFGQKPSFASILSYEAVSILATVIKECDSTNPDAIIAYLKQVKVFDGLNGSIAFNNDGDASRPLFLYRVNGNEFQIEPKG